MNCNNRKHSLKIDGNKKNNLLLPENKRPRLGASPISQAKTISVFDTIVKDIDPFGNDDDFTSAELEELEIIASQADQEISKNDGFKTPSFSRPLAAKKQNHLGTSENLSCLKLENKIRQLQNENDEKNGEACVLRDKLKEVERALQEERQSKYIAAQTQKSDLKSKEMELQKKLDSYRDRFEFQSAELKKACGEISNLKLKNQLISENKKTTEPVNPPISKTNKVMLVSPKSKTKCLKNFSDFNNETATFDNKFAVINQDRNKKIFLKRKSCFLKSSYCKRRIYLELQKSITVFHLQLQQYAAKIEISSECRTDTIDLLNTLMSNEELDVSCESQCQLLKCIGILFTTDSHLAESALQLLQNLIIHLSEFEACILMNDSIFPAIVPMLSTHKKASLRFLCKLARKLKSEHLDRFFIFVPQFSNLVNDSPHQNELVELLSLLLSNSTMTKHLLSKDIVSDICHSYSMDDKSKKNAELLPKVIDFFTSLVCNHMGMLNELTLQNIHYFCNTVLFDHFKFTEYKEHHCRGPLIHQAISLLYSLPNIYTMNHKQIVILWPIRDHFNCLSGFWSEEIKAIVGNEINSLQGEKNT